MKRINGLDILMSVVAIIALVVSVIAIGTSRAHASKEFQVAEGIKEDTAVLISTLSSVIHKGAVYSQQDSKFRDNPSYPEYVSLDKEKSIIADFVTSPTAFAYLIYASRKGEMTSEGEDEPWRTFFLRLSMLLSEDNQYNAAREASIILKDYFSFSDENSFDDILTEIEQLSESIQYSYSLMVSGNPILRVFAPNR